MTVCVCALCLQSPQDDEGDQDRQEADLVRGGAGRGGAPPAGQNLTRPAGNSGGTPICC